MRRLVQFLGTVAGIATMLAFFGEQWWGFDVIASFRAQYAAVLLGAAAVLILIEERASALWMIAAGAVNVALVASMFLGTPLPAGGSGRLELVTFNTQLLDPVPQLAWILQHDPDVVFLFESSRLAETALTDNTEYAVSSGIVPGREFGVTVLTRNPVTVEHVLSDETIGVAVRVEAEIDGRVVAVYGVHPASPTSQERSRSRNQDLELVGRRIAEETVPVVVAGDLNATPWSHGYTLLAAPADLETTQLGTGVGGSWPAHVWWPFRIPLDHVLHTRDLTTVEREVGPAAESDHLPVRAVLAVAAPSG